uniref:Uncharacterized protein n=1 Tax=Rhizophora mucronata TaxID=61149 RepID=A0A2P2PR80_RHIMU
MFLTYMLFVVAPPLYSYCWSEGDLFIMEMLISLPNYLANCCYLNQWFIRLSDLT